MADVNARLLWDIFRHVRSWLANLSRAGQKRRGESVAALRGVIKASRMTAVYLRQLGDTGRQNHTREAELAVLWTDLGFALEDLGIGKLAKRCRISGKHWSQPNHYDRDFLEKADISLDRMETLANEILHQVGR
jgi:hypothetical protein